MTTAKMKLVVVKVELEDEMEHPVANPDPDEHIVVKVVELTQLKRVLLGTCFASCWCATSLLFGTPKTMTDKYARCLCSECMSDVQPGFHCRYQAVSLCNGI